MPMSRPAPGRRSLKEKTLPYLLVLIALVAVHTNVIAGNCGYAVGSTQNNVRLALPSTVFLGHDVRIGEIFYSTSLSYGKAVDGNCSSLSNANQYEPAAFQTVGGTLTSWNQGQYAGKVFHSNVPGIGIIIHVGRPNFWTVAPNSSSSWPVGTAQGTRAVFNDTIAFHLIKIGDVGAGQILGGILPQIKMYYGDNRLNAINYAFTGATTITAGTCRTSDVNVDMGTHRSHRAFTGVGSGTPWVDVKIPLTNCPAFPPDVSLRYLLSPTTSILNPSQGVIALKAGTPAHPAATGIGLQVAKPDRTPVSYNTPMAVGFKPLNIEGASYTIALQARYYQTAAHVTPGAANAAMTFTLDYQ